MPKIKTHRGAKKRFHATATGKFKRQHAFARHILTSKTRKLKRKLIKSVVVDPGDEGRVRMMLPYE